MSIHGVQAAIAPPNKAYFFFFHLYPIVYSYSYNHPVNFIFILIFTFYSSALPGPSIFSARRLPGVGVHTYM